MLEFNGNNFVLLFAILTQIQQIEENPTQFTQFSRF